MEDTQLHGNRFAVLGSESHEVGDRPRRRLVLVSQHRNDRRGLDREWDSDTDTVGGAPDVEVTEVVENTLTRFQSQRMSESGLQ